MDEPAPEERIKAVIGLGNPGRRYEDNRHNFGYMVVDRLAFLKKEEFARGSGPFVYCRVIVGEYDLYLCKSTTYMNNTGKATAAIVNYFGIKPENLLVISDDCNLPLGKMRYRDSGSNGGHNGLASIMSLLQTRNFPRLRLGIEANPEGVPLEEYVLEDFTKEQFETVEKIIPEAISFMTKLVSGDIDNKSLTITIT
jgi:PTH1 family peptidyl-tRNA hydrolase